MGPVCGAGARCTMLALAVVSLVVCANGSRLPASSEQVMPKLHLAYLVEDVEYPRPEELQASNEELPHSSRVKRQSSPLAVNNQQVEAGEERTSAPAGRSAALSASILSVLEVANAKPTPVEHTGSYSGRRKRSAQQGQTASSDASEDVETFETASTTPGRNAALSAAILRVLEVAGAKPTPVELSGSYSGKKKRSAQLEPTHSNAHQYGLIEPKIDLVKVKSHGNFGKVVQASDDRRVKLLKVEENDFHALPRVIDASNKKKRADVEKQKEEAKVPVVQLTADQ